MNPEETLDEVRRLRAAGMLVLMTLPLLGFLLVTAVRLPTRMP
jgi:hypothetical protein